VQTIQVLSTAGSDGFLHLRIPVDKAGAEYEVVVVLQPKAAAARKPTPEELGWPPGFFEKTAGSIQDETFERPPQGEYEKRLGFD
jgi:hypothetical protein